MKHFFDRPFDPFSTADGPPPQELGAFLRWTLKGAWPVIWVAAMFGFLVGLSEAVAVWLLGWIVDFALSEGQEGFFADHWPVLLLIAAFFLLLRPLLMMSNAALNSISIGPNTWPLVLSRLTRHSLGQSLRFFEDDFAGRLAQKAVQTSRAVVDILNELVNSMTFAVSTVLAALFVLGQVNGWLSLGLLVWLLWYVALIWYFVPKVRRLSANRAAARAAVSGQLVDTLSNIATVKLFARTGQEAQSAEAAMERFRQTALQFGRLTTVFRGALTLLAGALPVLLIGSTLWLWQVQAATAGDIVVAGALSTRIAQMSGWISFVAMGIFANIGEIEDGARTLSPPHDLKDPVHPKPLPPARGRITFDAVTFGYGRPGAALDGVDLIVNPGEKVALVGRSGAGKSTLLSLLMRLYETEAGAVMLDGVDVRDYAQDALRARIAMVRQDTAMFNRSAFDNIAYGKSDASMDQVERAAREAAAHDFICDLEDGAGRRGYAAYLGERGVKLSGGQRQRIAIARAILKDAPVLLLDEATAALDSETEAAVQAGLERLMQTRTVIAIAHRLSTISAMDRIIVLDDGRIVEAGTHDSLLAQNGLYTRFWARQSGGFINVDSAE